MATFKHTLERNSTIPFADEEVKRRSYQVLSNRRYANLDQFKT